MVSSVKLVVTVAYYARVGVLDGQIASVERGVHALMKDKVGQYAP